MIINKKHQVFAEEYILTNDAIVSYQKAYPKAKAESARVGSYDILKKECVLKYIEEQKEKNKKQLNRLKIQSIKEQYKNNIDAINNNSEILLAIINKTTLVEEKCYDMQLRKVVVFYREPNPIEIIEAIKEYNRINGL